MPTGTADPLTLADGACLGLISAGRHHGWALVRSMAPDGEIGRIWRLSRPLTYRAIDGLVARGLVARDGVAPGGGANRTLLAVTRRGRTTLDRWLATPAARVRDVRTELLVKLALLELLGRDRQALLDAQRAVIAPIAEGRRAERSSGAAAGGADPVDLVALWRLESAESVLRFLDQAGAALPPPGRS